MVIDRLNRDVRKLREQTAKLAPQFSYYEQELIRRVIKSILPQLRDKRDISTAKEILEKTEWLDGENTSS
jgi:hypothetical protein